jgi:biotin synthase
MTALLRIMMPDINIAATTAMQAIDPLGREKAIKAGANVVMPNITPGFARKNYMPYDNKPCTSEASAECLECTTKRFSMVNGTVAYGEWGDSKHYLKRE